MKRREGMRCQHPLSGFQEEIPLSRGLSSDNYIEKFFLYLLVLSVVLHVAGFSVLYFWPKEQKPQLSEPTFIDLQDMPQLKAPEPSRQPEVVRPSDQRRRVVKESAPKVPKVAPTPAVSNAKPSVHRQSARAEQPTRPAGPPGPASKPIESGRSADELLHRIPQTQPQADNGGGSKVKPNLMPSASRMAKIEENYRRRFADDLDEGTTKFLNTDDIQFGSFLRRFETAVYGVWRYPQEAAQKGIQGVTPIKITFNRNGEIVKVQLLESSGSRILDDEVFRTLRLLGPMGKLPKSYGKEEFNLIAFFQYGNARGRLR